MNKLRSSYFVVAALPVAAFGIFAGDAATATRLISFAGLIALTGICVAFVRRIEGR